MDASNPPPEPASPEPASPEPSTPRTPKRPASKTKIGKPAPTSARPVDPALAAPAPVLPAPAPTPAAATAAAATTSVPPEPRVPPTAPTPPSAVRPAIPPRASIPIPALPDDEEGWIPIAEDDYARPASSATSTSSASSPASERRPPARPDEAYGGARGDDDFDDNEDDGGDDGGDDGADEFEPITEPDRPEPARTPPPGATPHDVLVGVRDGRLHVSTLNAIPDDAIEALASVAGIEPGPGDRRGDLLARLLQQQPEPEPTKTFHAEGLLELLPDGFGFLRKPELAYAVSPYDPYVSPTIVRRLGLQTGHWLSGTARAPRRGERYAAMLEVEEVNHDEPEALAKVVPFDKLTVTHPDRRFILETKPEEVAMRMIDLFCPLGRGQRALIVSPPRAGKTILLHKIADSLARNSPEVEIVVLLIDERPEEVTNMQRMVRGEVLASTFDQPPHRHIRVAELAMEKVRRMVELGRHVVVLLDSLTRLGRAYNNETGGAGRLLTGGLEASALTKPKRFFGAARNIEHGGSLTIVASALIDTGSRLDQVIFEEFKGTGNMEIVLSREVANQRLWPAIDLQKSGTRREDLLLHPDEQLRITALRRQIADDEPAEAITEILERMEKYRTNAELLMHLSLE